MSSNLLAIVPMTAGQIEETRALLDAPQKLAQSQYLLRLYVAGMSPRSADAIQRVTGFCDKHLEGRYELEVVDIRQEPSLLPEEQIVAVPALIKLLPAPIHRFIGDAQNEDRLLAGLGLMPQQK